VHRYEKGHSASLSVAGKLEKALKTKLVREINIFGKKPAEPPALFDDVIVDRALEKVHELGLKLALFDHAPFRAGSMPNESLVISKGASKHEVKKRAMELHKTSVAFHARGMLIASQTRLKSISHVPVVEEEELTTLSEFKDLIQLLRERARDGNEQ
jgi:predicted transcriptional regulator